MCMCNMYRANQHIRNQISGSGGRSDTWNNLNVKQNHFGYLLIKTRLSYIVNTQRARENVV